MTTARWLQLAVSALVLAAMGFALWAWPVHGPLVAIGGAIIILTAHVWTLALEFLWMHAANAGDEAPRATWPELASAWWRESCFCTTIFAWWQTFFAHAERDHLDAPSLNGRRALVLVHGFMCNRGMWNGWMRKLRAQNTPFMAVNLEPTFGSIDRYASTVAAAVQRAHASTGMAPVVVAHSMGGLAVRACLARLGASGSDAIHHVITLGTPHQGTAIGRWNPITNVVQMRRRSPWIQALEEGEAQRASPPFTCFYSHCDNIVFPASTATLTRRASTQAAASPIQSLHVRAMAHLQLIEHPDVWDTTMQALGEGQ